MARERRHAGSGQVEPPAIHDFVGGRRSDSHGPAEMMGDPHTQPQLDDDRGVDAANPELLKGSSLELAGGEDHQVEGTPAPVGG